LETPFTFGFNDGFVGEDCGRGFGRAQVGVEQADKHEANGAADELSGDEPGADERAMPAKVSENMRPIVIAGLAKLVLLVKK
jgi:hypothetical protein